MHWFEVKNALELRTIQVILDQFGDFEPMREPNFNQIIAFI